MKNKNFALVGAAGYIAPRHMRAIKENKCNLISAVDPFDSVGIMDSYFPNAYFFTEIEIFDKHIDKLKSTKNKIDFLSICSPNYLHDSHIRLGLKNDCDVVCEKPLVTNYKSIKYIDKIEKETGKKVYVILQLRHHPVIIDVKEFYKNKKNKVKVKLRYITSRGRWYHSSWKGQIDKSGGLALNIGIHFFDMLTWVFGEPASNVVTQKSKKTVSGLLSLEKADVEWLLSVDSANLPEESVVKGSPAFREITIDNKPIDFTNGFTDLHTISYNKILNGKGFGIKDAKTSLKIVNQINKCKD